MDTAALRPSAPGPGPALECFRSQVLAAQRRSLRLSGIVSEYMAALRLLREAQVRVAQLDKEAGELRAENDTLARAAQGAASSAQLREAEAAAARLREDLVAAYREKGEAAEASAAALRQLSVVRDNNASQGAELARCQAELKKARGEAAALRLELGRMEAAKDAAAGEVQARCIEAAAATSRSSALEDENRDLVGRVLALKDAQAEWMNEMNALRDQTLADARRQAADIVAKAVSEARAQMPRAAAGAAPGALDASMRSLDVAAAEAPAALPSAAVKTAPGIHPGGCFGLAWDRAGSLLASCGADKVVRLWDGERCAETAVLRGAHEGLNDVAITCDSRLVLGAEDRAAVRVWDVKTGRLINRALTGHSGKVTGVDASPADPDVAATCAAHTPIKLWSLERGVCTRTFPHCPSACTSLALTLDGAAVVSAHFDGSLRVWDCRQGGQAPHEVAGLHAPRGGITSVALGLGGGVVLTCGRDSVLRCVDLRTWQVRATLRAPEFRVGGAWASACLSPDSAHAAAGADDGSVFIWELATGEVAARLRPPPQRRAQHAQHAQHAHQQAAVACAWSPGGMPLVSCDKAGGVTFWGEGGRGSARAL